MNRLVRKIKPNLDEKIIDEILHVVGPVKPGDIVHVSINHDDDCPALKTNRLSDCTCSPDVERLNPC